MGTEWFSVRGEDDIHIAWVGYQNTADVWCGGAFSEPRPKNDWETRLGEWQCQAHPLRHDPHPIVWVNVTQRHPDTEWDWPYKPEEYRMKWCETCLCIVPPPFDGYAYHDYGCKMGRECSCRPRSK